MSSRNHSFSAVVILLILSLVANVYFGLQGNLTADKTEINPPPPPNDEFKESLLEVAKSFSIPVDGKTAKDIETDFAISRETFRAEDFLLSEPQLDHLKIVASDDLFVKVQTMHEKLLSLNGCVFFKTRMEPNQ